MNVERTVLLEFNDEQRSIEFIVERWFIAGDNRFESAKKPALIWKGAGGTEYVVVLGSSQVKQVRKILEAFE